MYTTGEIAAELCLEKPGLDTLDIAVFWGGSPTIASTQTILFNAALSGAHYLEQNAYVAVRPRGRALPAGHPRPARARARAAVGRHLAPGLVPPRPAGGQRQGARRRLQPGPDARRAADRGRRHRGHQGHGGRGEVRRPRRHRRPGDERDAAPREPAAQQVARLRARLRSPRSRALRDPRQPELQADRRCCRPTRRTPCSSSRPGGSASRRAARRSGTASCSACCAASAWSPSRCSRSRAEPVRLVDYLDKGASLGPDAPCLTTDGADPDVRRGAGPQPPDRRRAGRPRRTPGRQGGDPVGQRPARVHLRLRDQPGRRRVVPGQPAQRGRRRTASCSSSSSARRWSSRSRSRRWSSRSGTTSPSSPRWSASTATSPERTVLGRLPGGPAWRRHRRVPRSTTWP